MLQLCLLFATHINYSGKRKFEDTFGEKDEDWDVYLDVRYAQ